MGGEESNRGRHFGSPYRPQLVLGVGAGLWMRPLTERRDHHDDGRSRLRRSSEKTACTERLVVRMGGNDDQPSGPRKVEGWRSSKQRTGTPMGFRRAGGQMVEGGRLDTGHHGVPPVSS